jgi:hypothetical protein
MPYKVLWLPALLLVFVCQNVRGDQFGDFTYTASSTSITMTDFPTNVGGALSIPSTIAGKPVTQIGS